MRVLLVNEKEGLEYAPDAISIDKAGYSVETATVVMVTGPRGLPRPVAERLEKAFTEATRMEPYVSVARKNETIVGEPLTGQALADFTKKLNANYERLIKEAGLYKSERK